MLNITYGGVPVCDPQEAKRALTELNLPIPADFDKVNSLHVQTGQNPSHGHLLIQLGNLSKILDAVSSLTFALYSAPGSLIGSRTFNGLVVAREPVNLTPSLAITPNSLYLVEISDARWLCENPTYHAAATAMYNVSSYVSNNASGPTAFLPQSVMSGIVTGATYASPIVVTTSVNHGLVSGQNVTITGVVGNTGANGTFTITVNSLNTFTLIGSTGTSSYVSGGTWTAPWTWAGMIGNLWAILSSQLGAFPGLPVTPDGIPEGWMFEGVSAWGAICQVVQRIGCIIRPDLTQPIGSQFTIVQDGAADAAATSALSLATSANLLIYDGQFQSTNLARVPGNVIVHFRCQNETSPALLPQLPYTVTVAGPDSLANQNVSHPIWDDMIAVYSSGTLQNSAALATRASNRAADYYRGILQGGNRFWQIFSGLIPVAPGSIIRSVTWKNVVGQNGESDVTTTVVRFPAFSEDMPDYTSQGTAQDLVRLGVLGGSGGGITSINSDTTAAQVLNCLDGTVTITDAGSGVHHFSVPAITSIKISGGTAQTGPAITLGSDGSVALTNPSSNVFSFSVVAYVTGLGYLTTAVTSINSDTTSAQDIFGPISIPTAWSAGSYTFESYVVYGGTNYVCVNRLGTTGTPSLSSDWQGVNYGCIGVATNQGTTVISAIAANYQYPGIVTPIAQTFGGLKSFYNGIQSTISVVTVNTGGTITTGWQAGGLPPAIQWTDQNSAIQYACAPYAFGGSSPYPYAIYNTVGNYVLQSSPGGPVVYQTATNWTGYQLSQDAYDSTNSIHHPGFFRLLSIDHSGNYSQCYYSIQDVTGVNRDGITGTTVNGLAVYGGIVNALDAATVIFANCYLTTGDTMGVAANVTFAGTTSGTITANSTGTQLADGIGLAVGVVVLVNCYTGANQAYNGLYSVTTAGNTGVACVLTRVSPFNANTPGSQNGQVIKVLSGSTESGSQWVTYSWGTVATSLVIFYAYPLATKGHFTNATTTSTTPAALGPALPCAPSTNYGGKIVLNVGVGTSGFELEFTGPSGATFSATILAVNQSGVAQFQNLTSLSSASNALLPSTSVSGGVVVEFLLVNGAAGGTFQMLFKSVTGAQTTDVTSGWISMSSGY